MTSTIIDFGKGTSMKATVVDFDVTCVGDGVLWHLDKPVEYEDKEGNPAKTNYVITSMIANLWAYETLAFPANEQGEVLDWGEVGGDWHVLVSHDDVIRSMGYEVVK